MRRATFPAMLAIAVAALVGCSSGKAEGPAAAPSPASSAAPSPTAAPDSKALVDKLAKTIPALRAPVVYTAASDPNGKLGRPHQYISKTWFEDTRASSNPKAAADSPKSKTTITYGGTVEVFATAADAEAWTTTIDSVEKALGGFDTPDYVFRHGTVVVRVSHLLTTEQAAEYDKAVG